ncbi:MAG TPA: DUF6541 family protein [Actinomycetota bacterium]|nr:DUF6541 family protein [Actinomycetota bacterium]
MTAVHDTASDLHMERSAPTEPASVGTDGAEPSTRRPRWPLLVVGLTVLFNLVVLRAEATPVQYLNDASVHKSMVAWASDRIEAGHLPLDGWYPDLALGSSRFHHYQSLPHVLTGYLAVPLGADRAVAITMYLLLSLWPISVYAGGRLLGWGPGVCAMAAAVSPLVSSQPGLGFEWGSYLWRGYGVWAQAWGMWLLPLAWGLSWRAVSKGRSYALTAFVLALTVACHLLAGYLALASLAAWVLVGPSDILRRLGRAALVGFGSLLVAAWVVVPLIADRAYTIQDEFSRGKVFYDSFGAKQILTWFASGEIYDRGRLPVITILVVVGIVVAISRFRREERSRALLIVGLIALLLFFGRPTLGPLLKLLPGSGDLFLRRFVMGVHLAGMYLAGVGAVGIGRLALGVLRRRWITSQRVLAGVAVVAALVFLFPAWAGRAAFAATGARWIAEQQEKDATGGADIVALLETAEDLGPGRVYAGGRWNWGTRYEIGQVPMYAVLLNQSAEGVGFTRPTWSLSSPFEYRFNEFNDAIVDLFNVRYMILPKNRPRTGAEMIARRHRHVLWENPTAGFVRVVDVLPPIEADRLNLGSRVEDWFRSSLPAKGLFPSIAFASTAPAPPTTTEETAPDTPAGVVEFEDVDLREGTATATIVAERPAAVILKTSFDPRWQVTVDGEPVQPRMMAPSFVGASVPEGRHVVTFTYEPFPRYDVMLLIGGLTLVGLWLGPRWLRERRATDDELAPHPVAGDGDVA